MAKTAIYNPTRLKDQRKSRRIAIGVHAILLLLIAIPMANKVKEVSEQYTEVTVDFRDFKAASAMSAAAEGEEKTEEVEAAKPEVKTETAKTTPTKTVTERKPVKDRAPDVKNPVKSTVIENKPAPVKATTKPKVKTTTTKKPTATPKPVKVKTKAPVKTSGNKGAGAAAQGSSTSGNATTDGKAETGKQGMDFEGDALFARKVIRRAEIKHLSKKEGIMVVNLCVNQDGAVVYTEFNKKDSNIHDRALVTEAMKATKKYRFEPDYTAPVKQCGKLTYIIEL